MMGVGGKGPRPKGRRARVHNDFRNGGGRGPLSPSWPPHTRLGSGTYPPWLAGIRRYPRGDRKYPGTYTLNPWIIWEFKMNTLQYPVSSLDESDAHPTTLFHIRFLDQTNQFICKEPPVLPEHWVGASGWLCLYTRWPDLDVKKIVGVLRLGSQLLCWLLLCCQKLGLAFWLDSWHKS